FELICSETYKHMRKYSEEKVPIHVILFDFDGKTLARKSGE
ncbi:MAG: cobalt-precorrin-5B (C(1))-methyltransferase, partial [Nitrosopumilaceae archaeon]